MVKRGFTLEAAALLVAIVKNKPKNAEAIKWKNRNQLGGLIAALMRRGMIEHEFGFDVTPLGMEKYKEIQQMKIWR